MCRYAGHQHHSAVGPLAVPCWLARGYLGPGSARPSPVARYLAPLATLGASAVPVCPLLTPDIANQISSAGCWWGLDWLWWLLPDCARPGHESQVRCAALLHFYQLPTVNSPVSALCTAHGPVLTLSTYQHAGFHSSHICSAGCRVLGLGAAKNARGEKTWENGYQTIHTYLVLDIYTYLVCLVLLAHSVTPHNGYRTIIVAVVTIVTLLITLAFNVQYSRYLDEHEHFCGYEW